MARNSRQEDKNSYFVLFSISECIAWLKLFAMESVAIVMLNALKIIVYLKVRSFCKRSMYLVINQVVADMCVGSCEITRFYFLGKKCKFWTINFLNFSPLCNSFPCMVSLHFISVGSKPCCYFLGADTRNVNFVHSSIVSSKGKCLEQLLQPFGLHQGSAQQSCLVLDVIHSVIIADLNRSFFTLYLSFFLFFLLIPLFSDTSIAIKIVLGNQPQHHGATSRERKLTKALFIVTVAFLLLTLPIILFRISFACAVALCASRIVSNRTFFSVASFFEFVMFCKLPCQSSSLYA